MNTLKIEDLLDPQEMGKRVKQALDTTQKTANAVISAGANAFRSAAAQQDSGYCPECEAAQEHSDVKNYVCPPADICVPRCIANLELSARPGEQRIVPFAVRNSSNKEKKYQIGVRPFTDAQGNQINIPMLLSETAVAIAPGKSVMLELAVRIPHTAAPGTTYETDIVVREAKYNQNICFSLVIEGRNNVAVATPIDEKYLKIKFHRWHHHFYCTPPEREVRVPGVLPHDTGHVINHQEDAVTIKSDK